MIAAGKFDRTIRIERPVADDALDGAGSGSWELVAQLPAQVQDTLPSRGEQQADGMTTATRSARVRMRFREGIAPAMRVLVGRMVKGDDDQPVWVTDRTAQIVSLPAEMGRREGLEFMIQDYSPAGNPA